MFLRYFEEKLVILFTYSLAYLFYSFPKTALHWTLEGRRKQGRLKNTRRHTIETELKGLDDSCSIIRNLAGQLWRSCVLVGLTGNKVKSHRSNDKYFTGELRHLQQAVDNKLIVTEGLTVIL